MDKERKARIQRINNNRRPVVNDARRLDPELVWNVMTQRSDILNKMFDPRRDIDEECGYPKVIEENQYRRMYDRGLGRRVVDVYPSETWKEFPTIYEDPDPAATTPFEDALEKIDKQHQLLHYLHRADELSGVGHYGIILWGIDDGKSLGEPVDGFERWAELTGSLDVDSDGTTRRLLYIRVLDESLVQIKDYDQDPRSPRYGLPNHYNITLADPRRMESGAQAAPPDFTQVPVHWTRITHVADNRKTSEVLGTPRMEAVWDRLYDLRKILSGSGEMFWRGGFPGISLETQPGLEGAELDDDATETAMFNYMNGLQRYISLTGMSAKSLAPQIASPMESFEAQIKAICVTLGIPYRVFMGIEEGVVSGDQATRAWEVRLANRQKRYVTPMIINPVLRRLIQFGVLPPTAEPMGWSVEWPDNMAPSESEQAEIAGKKTEAFSKYVQGGVDQLIPPAEYLTIICGLEEDTVETIMEAAVEHIEETREEEQEQLEAQAKAEAAAIEAAAKNQPAPGGAPAAKNQPAPAGAPAAQPPAAKPKTQPKEK